jgi:hypothetical protein
VRKKRRKKKRKKRVAHLPTILAKPKSAILISGTSPLASISKLSGFRRQRGRLENEKTTTAKRKRKDKEETFRSR